MRQLLRFGPTLLLSGLLVPATVGAEVTVSGDPASLAAAPDAVRARPGEPPDGPWPVCGRSD